MIVIPAKAGIQAVTAVLFAACTILVQAAVFRWSSQGDYLSSDPQAQNEGINNNLNDSIFERLTVRDRTLALVPSLATSWEARSPTVWRFYLRKEVKFHDGSPFTADDVVFSIERAQLPSSNFKVFATPLGRARAIDRHTVEIETPFPSPMLLENVNGVRIMSRAWCIKHGALKPQDFKTGEETYASRHANG
ncbi:MAG TPA: ABC transporter substrate-binding protein, partial [Usitatibacter sp.]|nr:ABC transporter substrate-binding protein [Usitatibacter sp.]